MSNFYLVAMRLIRMAMLASAVMIVATPSEAAAKHHRHVAHHRCGCHMVQVAQFVAPPTPRLGPMRYFGGPKSPMWRAPIEN
jgi:hypothetical protein